MNIPVYSTIHLDFDEGIGLLELNTPPSNTMTMEFFAEFASVLEFIRAHTEFRALIISGRGRHFSSGRGYLEAGGPPIWSWSPATNSRGCP